MEDFVIYEIAVKLKEKGFKEQCLAYYTKDSDFYYNTSYSSDVENAFKSFNSRPNHICGKRIDAPIISQVLKWLREEKKLFVDIGMAYNKYYVGICKTDEFDEAVGRQVIEHAIGTPSNTYEKAAIAGIEYVVDNLI